MNRIDPAVKFICLVGLTIVLAWKYNPVLNLLVFAAGTALIIAGGIPLKKLLVLYLPVLLAAAGMFFTGYKFSSSGSMPVNEAAFSLAGSALANGLTHASRVLAYGGTGYLFALTTDRIRLVHSFRRHFRLPQIFAYGLLAAFGVFPQMLREFKRTRAAFRARGLSAFPLSPAVLKPLLVKSVRWSEALSTAMESRGFGAKSRRTEFEPALIRRADWHFAGTTAFLCILAGIML